MMRLITGGVVNPEKNRGVLFPESSGSNREYYYYSKIFKYFQGGVFRLPVIIGYQCAPSLTGTDNHG